MKQYINRKNIFTISIVAISICWFAISLALSQQQQEEQEEYEKIDSSKCIECHEESSQETNIKEDLSHSIHDGFECLDCHIYKDTLPHKEIPEFGVGCAGCKSCHEDAAEEYKGHGRAALGECEELPFCSDCHGGHKVLPSTEQLSKTHPANLPQTCGKCHEDLEITKKYEILIDHPIEIYEKSVHGKATKERGIYGAATCNDCHSNGGTAHKIFSPGNPESAINHFNIPNTCGKCHVDQEKEYWEGIHGKLAKRGETDSPVCTDCHGEHGILSHDDPRSPVSPVRVAETTCAPCHESVTLTEKYGLQPGRVISFLDSYHGLKTKAGDLQVANCASCHGVHRILSSTDSTSTIHPNNLQKTCGECHPGISAKLASTPIHGIGGEGLQTKAADVVEKIYIIAIILIIGSMVLHWLIDLFRQIQLLMRNSNVRRMQLGEVWQHTFLMVSFIVLVVSGFALRYNDAWIAKLFFGFEGGFELRGTVHRIAAIVLVIGTIWHIIFLFSKRGKQFIKDIFPTFTDLKDFIQRIRYNLGRSKDTPRFGRFSYVEKAEYWALIWGNGVMIITGILLWFDNYFIQFLPKGVLDVSLIIHYYEAILASLSILIWHLYSTVFNPKVYPMNPSWLNGKMPKKMYEHEHPNAELEVEKEKEDDEEEDNENS